jgi:glycosyltransferase involved in cell wall biosynthesis
MKILYGITKSNFGGAQRYVFDLATEAVKAGHEVAVLCGGEGLLTEKLRAEKIRVITTPYLERDISVVKEWQSFRFILETLTQEKPDVFHVNSSKMGGLGSLAGRLARVKKIVFTAHGWPFWEKRRRVTVALMYFFSWLTALLSHHVITVSNYDLKVGQRMPVAGRKMVRIYNGIDFRMEFEGGEVIRNAFPPQVSITGTIGELNDNKNQITLVERAREKPGIYVAIVGEGERREFLENKIREYGLEERVKLFGYLSREKVMKGFDTFALPSLKEGLPYVLIEARLAGLKIDANRVGGVGEILDQDLALFSLDRMVRETLDLYQQRV